MIDAEKRIRLGRLLDTEELVCDICGAHIGWVSPFDLNSSYFYCDKCKAEVKS